MDEENSFKNLENWGNWGLKISLICKLKFLRMMRNELNIKERERATLRCRSST